MSLSQIIFLFELCDAGADDDLVVPKTVLLGSSAYRLARDAPRPRVAPIISILGILKRSYCCILCKGKTCVELK